MGGKKKYIEMFGSYTEPFKSESNSSASAVTQTVRSATTSFCQIY